MRDLARPPALPRRRALVAAAVGSFLVASTLASCGDDDGASPGPTTTATTASLAPGPTSGVATTVPPASSSVPRNYDFAAPGVAASGLDAPWGLAFLPDGSALVSERDSGRILQVTAGRPATEVTVIEGVSHVAESGLLGLAVSPNYASDGFVYAYFTTSDDNRIVRFTLADPDNLEVLVDGIDKAQFHNGGRLAFGPDGMLYATTGDATKRSNAQDPDSLNGKILRMTPDGAPPPDNPDPTSLVWSLGHRNVQGLAWDSSGRLFAPEFGQDTFDEVNLIEPGANYGWPEVAGTGGAPAYVDPLITWTTDESSPSGAAISGDVLYVAALRGEGLWRIPITGDGLGEPEVALDGAGRIRTVAVAPDGALWVMTSNTDGRGDPGDDDDQILRFAPV
jgi:glucose/arabinose dehydrogenase